MQARHEARPPLGNALKPAGRFGLQLMEMCFVMCAGGSLLDLAFFQGAAAIGYPALAQSFPEISMLVIGVNWALAMAAWMAFRGHGWRHNIEMSATAPLVAIVFSVASGAGLVLVATPLGWFSLFLLMCGPACALMAADMLFRYKHYASPVGM